VKNEQTEAIEIAIRIPGKWSHPKELVERLPAGYHLTPERLIMPDKTEIEFGALPPDNQFPQIFRSSLRQAATPDELATADGYKVNLTLCGPGGSLDSARTMMRAAAAIVRAGGAGVFIDNCLLAHGAQNWLSMTDDGSPDAVSFAFVSIVQGKTESWTMGMHVLGLCDIVMKCSDAQADDFGIIDVIRYMARGERPVGDGHILADLTGPRFRASKQPRAEDRPGSPVHNPFGRLKLVSTRDIAENN
jgi:hypothetical protein